MKYILIALPFIIGFILIAMRRSRYTEIERKIYADSLKEVDAWRKGLQRNDLVQSNGITYRIESVGYYCECRTYSDVKFILLKDLWPVE